MIHTARQLKDLVRNRSKGNSTLSQIILRNYAMERFLERIAMSPYKDNFVLKGGMLVSAMVGLDTRMTMDMDATLRNQHLSAEHAKQIVSEINLMGVMIDNNVLLSKELSLSLDAYQHRLNHNVLIIGGSGAGKTRFYAEPNIMQMNTSYVVTDPKGEILMKCGEMLRAAGYKVRVFNTIEMEHSNNYNPFHYVFDEKGQVSEVKIKKMVNVLFEATKGDGEKDDMWQQKGRTVIEAIVFLLFEESEYYAQKDKNGLIIPETRDESHS